MAPALPLVRRCSEAIMHSNAGSNRLCSPKRRIPDRLKIETSGKAVHD